MKPEVKENGRAAAKKRRFLTSCLGEVFVILLMVMVVVTVLSLVMPPSFTSQASVQPGCEINTRFPGKVLKWCQLITSHAKVQDLPPDLIAALIWYESGGNASAISKDGAIGLMQVMPRDGIASTFDCKGKPCFSDRPTSIELQAPEYNIAYGTELLKGLIDHFGGDFRQALKAYGPIGVGYNYADAVLAIFERYMDQ